MADDNMHGDAAPATGHSHTLGGIILVILGLVVGGGWTVAMLLGESLVMGTGGPHPNDIGIPVGTIITGLASVALVVSGVVLMTSTQARNLVRTAFWIAAVAAAGYVFGFVACFAAHQ